MILPCFEKYDEARQQPYTAFLDRLQRFLELDDSILITSGFSFGDAHINSIVFEALTHRPRSHVFSLQYQDLVDGHVLVRTAKVRRNLAVLMPTKGVIGGVSGSWRLLGSMPVEAGLFEKNAPTAADPKPTNGRLMLGAFGIFCAFLGTFG
jgi:hypothetical protein